METNFKGEHKHEKGTEAKTGKYKTPLPLLSPPGGFFCLVVSGPPKNTMGNT